VLTIDGMCATVIDAPPMNENNLGVQHIFYLVYKPGLTSSILSAYIQTLSIMFISD
jgi:hypothetical protein